MKGIADVLSRVTSLGTGLGLEFDEAQSLADLLKLPRDLSAVRIFDRRLLTPKDALLMQSRTLLARFFRFSRGHECVHYCCWAQAVRNLSSRYATSIADRSYSDRHFLHVAQVRHETGAASRQMG